MSRYKMAYTNTRQADGMLPYIDWAIQNGFGVIDINIPNHSHQTEVSFFF